MTGGEAENVWIHSAKLAHSPLGLDWMPADTVVVDPLLKVTGS